MLEIKSHGELIPAEMEQIITAWWGEWTDGWMGVSEQVLIAKEEDGVLKVSFYNPEVGMPIMNGNGLKGEADGEGFAFACLS